MILLNTCIIEICDNDYNECADGQYCDIPEGETKGVCMEQEISGDGEMEEYGNSIEQETSRDGDTENYSNSTGERFRNIDIVLLKSAHNISDWSEERIYFLEICNDNSECMEGQSCIFTDNPFLGECIYDDTDDNKNLKGKDIVKHPVSMEVSDLILQQQPLFILWLLLLF